MAIPLMLQQMFSVTSNVIALTHGHNDCVHLLNKKPIFGKILGSGKAFRLTTRFQRAGNLNENSAIAGRVSRHPLQARPAWPREELLGLGRLGDLGGFRELLDGCG